MIDRLNWLRKACVERPLLISHSFIAMDHKRVFHPQIPFIVWRVAAVGYVPAERWSVTGFDWGWPLKSGRDTAYLPFVTRNTTGFPSIPFTAVLLADHVRRHAISGDVYCYSHSDIPFNLTFDGHGTSINPVCHNPDDTVPSLSISPELVE